MTLEIRLIKDSEYEAVNDFFNNARSVDHHYQKTKRLYEHFTWEFLNGPAGKAIYAIAIENESESKIVGIQCAIPVKMISLDGKSVLSAKGEDTIVDIRAQIKNRKIDIVKELYLLIFKECQKNGIDYIWGFNSVLATFKRLNFDFPFKSSYGVLVLRPIKAYENIVKLNSKNTNLDKVKIAALTVISYFISFRKYLIFSKNKNYKINFELNDNIDLFKRASIKDKQLFFLFQDDEYLKWRITENPYPISYKSFQVLNEGNILKMQVICSINNDVAFIEQILFDKNLNKSVVYYLLKKIIKIIYNEKICLIRYSGFSNNIINKNEKNIIKNIGFVFTKKGEQFVCKNLSDNSILNPYNIFLSRLYKQGRN